MITLEQVLEDFTGFIDFLVYETSFNNSLLSDLIYVLTENCINTGKPYHIIDKDGWIDYESSDYLDIPENDRDDYISVIEIVISILNKENTNYSVPKRATPEQKEVFHTKQN